MNKIRDLNVFDLTLNELILLLLKNSHKSWNAQRYLYYFMDTDQ